MSNAIKGWAVVALVIALAVCAVILTRDAHQLLLKADNTAAELARTSRLVADYAEKQKAIMENSITINLSSKDLRRVSSAQAH